jgi:hypothetical protein
MTKLAMLSSGMSGGKLQEKTGNSEVMQLTT